MNGVMNWQNLRDGDCPYCGDTLANKGEMMVCGNCTFHIEITRYRSMTAPRPKWSNLDEDRCPLCNNMLKKNVNSYYTLTCMTPECTFKITEEKFREILDKQKFYAQQREAETL